MKSYVSDFTNVNQKNLTEGTFNKSTSLIQLRKYHLVFPNKLRLEKAHHFL